jgi:hypothetical protein
MYDSAISEIIGQPMFFLIDEKAVLQSIPWSAAPSSTWLLLVTSAFVTPIVTRGVAAKPCAIRAPAVVEVPVSFQKKETGTGWRNIRPSE